MKTLTIYCGPPCSGKSTLALRTGAPRFSVRHWFEPLRRSLTLPPPGGFLDDKQVFAAVKNFLTNNNVAEHIVFDGFPGNYVQLEWVLSELSKERQIVFRYISTDRKTALERALARLVCYHCDGGADPVMPMADGRCPICGCVLGRRPDDSEEGFQERWENYFVRVREMYRLDRFGLYRTAMDIAHRAMLNEGMRMDLHLHTTSSDGIYNPTEIIDKVSAAGIELCAVTDHDTISGLTLAREHALRLGLALLTGIEVSALWQGQLIHLLGYGIDYNNAQLNSVIEYNQRARRNYDERVLCELERRGILSYCSVNMYDEYEWNRHEGGWKLLNFLTKLGVCKDGFDYFHLIENLNVGEILYLSAEEVIKAIHNSGLCVLAHPGTYGWSEKNLSEQLEKLREAGIDGVECRHPHNDLALTSYLLDYCAQRGLLSTGGSDDHGNLPDRALGIPKADTRMLSSHTVTNMIIWPDK